MWVRSPTTPPALRLAPRLPPASRPRHRLCPVPEGPSPKPPRDLLPLLLVPAQASPRHRGPASFYPLHSLLTARDPRRRGTPAPPSPRTAGSASLLPNAVTPAPRAAPTTTLTREKRHLSVTRSYPSAHSCFCTWLLRLTSLLKEKETFEY